MSLSYQDHIVSTMIGLIGLLGNLVTACEDVKMSAALGSQDSTIYGSSFKAEYTTGAILHRAALRALGWPTMVVGLNT